MCVCGTYELDVGQQRLYPFGYDIRVEIGGGLFERNLIVDRVVGRKELHVPKTTSV